MLTAEQVNDSRSLLKICDLGTAIDRSDAATAHNEITPYLISRFYRAPEIILGMPYDYAVDMWSIGCTLYEMYTGKILFTGDSNNQMLKAIMEIRGKIGGKLYRRGQLWRLHFDETGGFISQERDRVLNKVRQLPLLPRRVAAAECCGRAVRFKWHLFLRRDVVRASFFGRDLLRLASAGSRLLVPAKLHCAAASQFRTALPPVPPRVGTPTTRTASFVEESVPRAGAALERARRSSVACRGDPPAAWVAWRRPRDGRSARPGVPCTATTLHTLYRAVHDGIPLLPFVSRRWLPPTYGPLFPGQPLHAAVDAPFEK